MFRKSRQPVPDASPLLGLRDQGGARFQRFEVRLRTDVHYAPVDLGGAARAADAIAALLGETKSRQRGENPIEKETQHAIHST
jgi:hypothetical protein